MSKTFVWAGVEISVLNVSIGVKLIKYYTARHTLRGSWYIKATNLNIKYDCMKDSVLLRYDAVSLSNRLATIRGNLISSWSVETSRYVRNSWTLRSFMICTIRCLEASESDHSVPRCHISESNPQPHPLPNPLNSACLCEGRTCWWRFANYTKVSSTDGIIRNSTCLQSMQKFMLS